MLSSGETQSAHASILVCPAQVRLNPLMPVYAQLRWDPTRSCQYMPSSGETQSAQYILSSACQHVVCAPMLAGSCRAWAHWKHCTCAALSEQSAISPLGLTRCRAYKVHSSTAGRIIVVIRDVWQLVMCLWFEQWHSCVCGQTSIFPTTSCREFQRVSTRSPPSADSTSATTKSPSFPRSLVGITWYVIRATGFRYERTGKSNALTCYCRQLGRLGVPQYIAQQADRASCE